MPPQAPCTPPTQLVPWQSPSPPAQAPPGARQRPALQHPVSHQPPAQQASPDAPQATQPNCWQTSREATQKSPPVPARLPPASQQGWFAPPQVLAPMQLARAGPPTAQVPRLAVHASPGATQICPEQQADGQAKWAQQGSPGLPHFTNAPATQTWSAWLPPSPAGMQTLPSRHEPARQPPVAHGAW